MARAFAMPGSSGAVGPDTQVKYLGFAVRETASATAEFRVRDGSATGTILDTISLAADESATAWYGPNGLNTDGQLYLEIVSGDIEGSLRLL